MSKAMIMSLGGSPEPLKKSIETHKPELLVFLASHDSIRKSNEVLDHLTFKPRYEFEITDDPNLILECYKKARNCVERVKNRGLLPREVTVDYTGGTKVMTAALILATIGQPFKFNYVGGEQRNKDGLGIVENGHEKMYPEMNPWSIFAEEERRQVITLFNRRRFTAVLEIIDTCSQRDLPLEITNYFQFIRPPAEGYLFWEQFHHTAALRKLDDGSQFLAAYLRGNNNCELESFATKVNAGRVFLQQILTDTEKLEKLHPVLIDDLMNNARRRMMDKRYDDAAARIYRTLELYGQICFSQVSGHPTDKVPPEVIPDRIRGEYTRKYEDPRTRLLKIPLGATFEFLNEMGHEAGKRFMAEQKRIKNIQSSRNASILAHGIRPVTEWECQAIFETVSDFVNFNNPFDLPALP